MWISFTTFLGHAVINSYPHLYPPTDSLYSTQNQAIPVIYQHINIYMFWGQS